MLSKNQIKLITSLKNKKFRQEHQLFVVEGIKTITEFLNSNYELEQLFTVSSFNIDAKKETIISESDLKKISFLKSPNQALGVFKIPRGKPVDINQLIVALDAVRDPGNLGTIIRLCDWFGISELVCSETTVDCYNPKVIQASMGSLTRVNVSYKNLEIFIDEVKLPTFGAYMDGKNVYQTRLPKTGILIMGNEANGISKSLEKKISHKISIPRFGELQKTESLNVATATAILLSEFKRTVFY
ncbi:RNA methyltransferase [Hanstruepera neustonica]|uniref:RNA methyltransferase n=1 Tax=Hanstruepera neustonica TaxID=1445657 RepID=A0A2K1E4R4_9FLAO|nr:RNA methyltransferase [Hanstruepera neustonica]PNQ75267.1 RNA methyltransferase [Hanstruepera neustonica]